MPQVEIRSPDSKITCFHVATAKKQGKILAFLRVWTGPVVTV